QSLLRRQAHTKDFLANVLVQIDGHLFYSLEQITSDLRSHAEVYLVAEVPPAPSRVNTRSVDHGSQASRSAEVLHSQTSLLGTFAKRNLREKGEMAGHFETSPKVLEPAMSKTIDIRRGHNNPAGIWTETLSALAEQIDWINGVFNHVIECNHIELV